MPPRGCGARRAQGAGQPAICRAGLKEHCGAARSGRLDIDVGLERRRDVTIRHECGRAHQSRLLRRRSRGRTSSTADRGGGQHSRGFERHGHAESVISRAG